MQMLLPHALMPSWRSQCAAATRTTTGNRFNFSVVSKLPTSSKRKSSRPVSSLQHHGIGVLYYAAVKYVSAFIRAGAPLKGRALALVGM